MTATFSTSESASLDRDVDLDPSSSTIQLADIWTQQRLEECQQWILRNDYKKVGTIYYVYFSFENVYL